MIYQPATIPQLRDEILRASAQGEQGVAFRLDAFNRVLEHTPEDMTVTVEAGLTLAALQERLAQRGQWLPIDPPNPDTASITDILNENASGPRRFGYGTIREHLLGLKVVLPDGRLIQCGGKVVKNVAGYDLCKLFVGSRGSLGVMVEATFKVRPLPEAERIVAARCDSLSHAAVLLEAIHDSELTPVVLDLHNLPAHKPTVQSPAPRGSDCWIVLALAGAREEVDWQLDKAAGLGLRVAGDLEYEKIFWSRAETGPGYCVSTLPSRITEVLQSLGASEFVSRAGNGLIHYRGGKAPSKPEMPLALMERIKETYDPNRVLPGFTLP